METEAIRIILVAEQGSPGRLELSTLFSRLSMADLQANPPGAGAGQPGAAEVVDVPLNAVQSNNAVPAATVGLTEEQRATMRARLAALRAEEQNLQRNLGEGSGSGTSAGAGTSQYTKPSTNGAMGAIQAPKGKAGMNGEERVCYDCEGTRMDPQDWCRNFKFHGYYLDPPRENRNGGRGGSFRGRGRSGYSNCRGFGHNHGNRKNGGGDGGNGFYGPKRGGYAGPKHAGVHKHAHTSRGYAHRNA